MACARGLRRAALAAALLTTAGWLPTFWADRTLRADLDASGPTATAEGHWPQFRGPNRDLISPDTRLLREWPEAGPPLVWKSERSGQGYSSVSVVDGRVYTQGHLGSEERVIALDAETGSHIWSVVAGPAASVQSPGSRSTPTVDGDHLYVESVGGDVACLDTTKGRDVWRRHLVADFKGRPRPWGYSESPLVDGDRLICTPGSKDATVVALDKRSGDVLWKGRSPTADGASYASPIAIEAGGVRQVVIFVAGGVMGFRASDGEFLWRQSRSANPNANITTPVYRDGSLFSASSYGGGGALVHITPEQDGFSAQLVYHTKHMKNHHGGFVIVDNYIYGANESVWTCLNFKTGDVMWADRSVGKGSVVYADGYLYLRDQDGPVALVKATPDGYIETGRFSQPHRSGEPAWAYPVITGGRLYLRDQNVLLCYDLRRR